MRGVHDAYDACCSESAGHRASGRVAGRAGEHGRRVPARGEMGAHAVELDVRRTVDGVLVVHHDPRPAPTGGSIARRASGRSARRTCPTLAAALDACAGMWVNVEIKNDPDEPDFDPTDAIADETMARLLARGDARTGG